MPENGAVFPDPSVGCGPLRGQGWGGGRRREAALLISKQMTGTNPGSRIRPLTNSQEKKHNSEGVPENYYYSKNFHFKTPTQIQSSTFSPLTVRTH